MNTAKQVNVMIGLMFIMMIGGLLYFLWDDDRAEQATQVQGREMAERGGNLYSLNCRSCHGLQGTGIQERAGLPGLPLNLDANRPPELTGGALEARQKRFYDTIVCGRVGTVMPPWHVDQGGALNSFQIEQLVALITGDFSLEGWEHAVEQANHSDEFIPAKHLAEPVGIDDTEIQLDFAQGINPSTDTNPVFIRVGGHTLEDPYELFKVIEVDEETDIVTVERGTSATGTEAMEHEGGVEVFAGPIAPGTTITGDPEAQGFPPCGQRPAAPQNTGATGGGEAVALADGAKIDMGDNFFDAGGAQNPGFTIAAGTAASVTLTNTGTAIHNMRIAGGDGEYNTDDDIVSDPEQIRAGEQGTIAVNIPAAGSYDYQCDFHAADMKGTITVQ
jgi:plastocyanin